MPRGAVLYFGGLFCILARSDETLFLMFIYFHIFFTSYTQAYTILSDAEAHAL